MFKVYLPFSKEQSTGIRSQINNILVDYRAASNVSNARDVRYTFNMLRLSTPQLNPAANEPMAIARNGMYVFNFHIIF